MVWDPNRVKRRWTQYDVEGGEDICKQDYVIMGRKSNSGIKEYYVPFFRSTSVDGEYRRAGVGLYRVIA